MLKRSIALKKGLLLRIGAVANFLVFFALALGTIKAKTPTVDEPIYIGYGRQLWLFEPQARLSRQPPLSDWLIGSLLVTEPNLPDLTQMASWPTGDRPKIAHEFLWRHGLNVERVALLARLPVLFAGVLLGSLMARWAYERQGLSGQFAASLLFAYSPNLLAFSSVATTDLPIVVTYFAALFTLWRYWQKPSRPGYVLAGLCLGLALGVKLTALLLLPLTLILCYSQWRRDQPWWKPGVIWLGLLPIAGLTLWGLYGFEVKQVSGAPFPIPAGTYVDNFRHADSQISRGHETFLLGQRSSRGWWYYFFVTLLLKSPVPILILAGLAAGLTVARRRWRQDIFLWVPAAALMAVASYTRFNLGHRHILPVEPLLSVWAVGAVPTLLQKRLGQIGLGTALAWYVLAGVRQYPHYLAYFNELAGGPAEGYRYLSDSNIDWGQDLKLLADYQKRNGLDSVYLSYFGSGAPDYYGLQWRRLLNADEEAIFPIANPAPGYYAISVTNLHGMFLNDPETFDWFRRREPIEKLGYSIFIYQVPEQAEGSWIAHCLDPVALLEPEQASQLVGQANPRQVYFTCEDSWVFPKGGQPGWYILPLGKDTAWVEKHFPGRLVQVYEHPATALAASYAVYYWSGKPDVIQALTGGQTQSALTTEDRPMALPVRFGETVELAGYGVEAPAWYTVWRVHGPAPAPLSVLSHFYYGEPLPLVADGLGFTSEQWNAGDVFVQWYDFPQATSESFLETGLYNYPDGESLTFDLNGQTGERLRLASRK